MRVKTSSSRNWGVSLFALLLSGAPAIQAQVATSSDIGQAFARYHAQALPEKLFLHLDRPLYLCGETAWFKVYAVDGMRHRPLPFSSVAYVEVLDKDQKPVLQAKVALKNASGQGSLALPASLASGRYTVRAYTSWMQNFSPEYFFQEPITILNTARSSGTRPVRTDSTAFDVQFFPEGGQLVASLPSKVAFKVTDARGKAVAAQGTVLDDQGRSVASFQTQQLGMGHLELTPAQAGAAYQALVQLPGGVRRRVALPAVQPQGYTMRLDEASPQTLRITVRSNSATQASENIVLLGHARQQVFELASGHTNNGQVVFEVSKQKLDAGIAHFTVFSGDRKPVCERLYFTPPARELGINLRTDKAQYGRREKVSLQVDAGAATDRADLSVAVFRLDSLGDATAQDMAAYLWLRSDLKGAVENPRYYLQNTPDARTAADNLMLTQGWSRFTWSDVLAGRPAGYKHMPELNGHLIRGSVLLPGGTQPAPNVPVYLASPNRGVQVYSAVSGTDGTFQRELRDLTGLRPVVTQPANRADSLYRIELLNPFSERYTRHYAGPFQLPDYPGSSLAQRHVQAQVHQTYLGRQLNRFQAATTDTVPFYGRPDERYLLDDYTRFKQLEDVMREYVPGVQVRRRADGFHFMVADKVNKTIFSEAPLVLLDGVPVSINKIMAFDPLKIRRLDVVASNYFLGPNTYKGVVSYSTYGGDLAGFPLDAHTLLQEYEGTQLQREFYAPRYDTPEARQSRLPDLRHLLYWNGAVSSTGTPAPLEFYTGDQPGRYVAVVHGLSASGLAGSRSLTFEVKAAQ